MNAPSRAPDSLSPDLAEAMEVFARDLLRLIRSVRIYPSGHPTLSGIAEGLVESAPLGASGRLELGVARTEIVVKDQFLGGKTSRCGELAALFHARKVLRVVWSSSTSPSDVSAFARLLGTRGVEGPELRENLQTQGISSIEVEPLDLDDIHGVKTDRAPSPAHDPEQRRRDAWLRLQSHALTDDQVASLVASDEFWTDLEAASTLRGTTDSDSFVTFLTRLGGRLESGLALLSFKQREGVLDHLAHVGRNLPVSALVDILSREDQQGDLNGQTVSSLLSGLDGERFVDLLAGLAAQGGAGTRRLAGVYRRFAPADGEADVLSLVRARLSAGKDHKFAAAVWKTVEEFVLKLQEDPFMESEYSEALEGVAVEVAPTPEGPQLDLLEDPGSHLDEVFLGLSAGGEREWKDRFLKRFEARIEEISEIRRLELVALADQVLSGEIGKRSPLIRRLFRLGLAKVRNAAPAERKALLQFCVGHQNILLDCALKALAEEQRISSRRFLVDVLASFSNDAVPIFVSKARSGPWYVARNLLLVLGRRSVPWILPVLEEFLDHNHAKVRTEALRALGHQGSPEAVRALRDFGGDARRKRDEREFARRVLSLVETQDTGLFEAAS